jgi:hypothetical protein
VDAPQSPGGSFATGVSGSDSVGYFVDVTGNEHGYFYDGKHFSVIDEPNASTAITDLAGVDGTEALGISGSSIVGYYVDSGGNDHGFLLSGTTYTTVDDPLGVGSTIATGVSGSLVTGYYSDTNGDFHGFLLSGTTYTTLDEPNSSDSALDSASYDGTLALGISGTDIVGYYVDSGGNDHGFLLSGNTYTTLDNPASSAGTYAAGISGTTVVGYYYDSNSVLNGFVLSGTTYTTVDEPAGVNGTQIMGISDGAIVGDFQDSLGTYNGFYAGAPAIVDIGRFTLLLSATDMTATVPQGIGYGTMVASKKGAVSISGKLPDGESFTATAVIDAGASPHFTINRNLTYPSVTPRNARGSLMGTLTFGDSSGSDLDGSLTWSKPAQTRGAYQAAINTTLNVIGSVYAPPTRFVSVLPGFVSGTLELSDTGALSISGSNEIDKSVTLSTKNQLVIGNPGADKLKISITPSTGAFKGTFLYPNNSRATSFGGVLFQDRSSGGGFFLGPDGSGTVGLGSP